MTRLALCADVHLANHKAHGGPVQAGLNRRCCEVLHVLANARDRARQLGCKALFVLGDLFDSSRPEPQVIAAAQSAFAGIETYVLKGNHDTVSAAAGDHALGPLDGHDLIEVIEHPKGVRLGVLGSGLSVLCVPYQPGNAREWLPSIVDAKAPKMKPNVLFLHMGIVDGSTPPWLRGSPNAVDIGSLGELCAKHGIRYVFAGDWHRRQVWTAEVKTSMPEVMQVGTLCPHSFSDEGLEGYGTLAILDSEAGLTWEEIPGPRFVKIRAGEPLPPVPVGCSLYLRVVAGDGKLDEARAHVASLVEQGVLTAGEAVVDEEEVSLATRTAARAASSRETVEEALEAYVTDMPLDPGIDRAAVLERCRGFMK